MCDIATAFWQLSAIFYNATTGFEVTRSQVNSNSNILLGHGPRIVGAETNLNQLNEAIADPVTGNTALLSQIQANTTAIISNDTELAAAQTSITSNSAAITDAEGDISRIDATTVIKSTVTAQGEHRLSQVTIGANPSSAFITLDTEMLNINTIVFAINALTSIFDGSVIVNGSLAAEAIAAGGNLTVGTGNTRLILTGNTIYCPDNAIYISSVGNPRIRIYLGGGKNFEATSDGAVHARHDNGSRVTLDPAGYVRCYDVGGNLRWTYGINGPEAPVTLNLQNSSQASDSSEMPLTENEPTPDTLYRLGRPEKGQITLSLPDLTTVNITSPYTQTINIGDRGHSNYHITLDRQSLVIGTNTVNGRTMPVTVPIRCHNKTSTSFDLEISLWQVDANEVIPDIDYLVF